jgi:hypothetical protein
MLFTENAANSSLAAAEARFREPASGPKCYSRRRGPVTIPA